ncbi:hypothetical protein HanXRQr2_Chr04g0176181 [Helianthus annuus]|uniref:Uncharacterized protein n=1 Tax=Helianthus annuus TaxID=4232 RepID=A0A9K3J9U3_HELAN|nr:hypothetical protein HanXRQr2_Chr04g0176181 [Helianthus annuus]
MGSVEFRSGPYVSRFGGDNKYWCFFIHNLKFRLYGSYRQRRRSPSVG